MSQNQNEKILTIAGLSNRFESKPLLQNVSFNLEKGEILCLLGPSGSGKTTLLRVIAGLEAIETGSITFLGQDLEGVVPHKRNIGMMFQEYALFPHKNVYDNISFGLEMQKLAPDKSAARIVEMLQLVGLEGFGHRRIDELSGGEKQRVALARSLAPKPPLLLLDEPLGSLDRGLRQKLAAEIRGILKSLGVTGIFVTHDQEEAFCIADKIGILHGGILQQFASPEETYRYPRNTTVAKFLGFTNLIQGDYSPDQNSFDCPLGQLQISNPPEILHPGRGTILIRPEAARLYNPPDSNLKPAHPVLTGTIQEATYQGSRYKLTLLCKGLLFSFEVPIEPQPPPTGTPVQLIIDRAGIVGIFS